MTRADAYPYEYVDSWKQFIEINLPANNMFYYTLTQQSISDVDYCHAKYVFNGFEMQDLRDYRIFFLLAKMSWF